MPDIKTLESIIGTTIDDQSLYETALTHRSYLNEFRRSKKEHNERMEFLGDAVLELVVTEYLYRNYQESEGILTNWRSALVKTESLSSVAEKLHLEDHILLSRGERNGSPRAMRQIQANTMEALIGAIYLDKGYETVQRFVIDNIVAMLPAILAEGSWQDSKTRYQEVVQEKEGHTPQYHVLEESGPDHDKRFTVGVYIDNTLRGQGVGTSKQAAQQEAAWNALQKQDQDSN
ncbi:ribonuclease III [Candidatus Saccharibacteria bacterium QS_5_54_17]|nr:MAG: ribonuclease III [Candidatus Saccharibacteria bacterium QS_5_54_17]